MKYCENPKKKINWHALSVEQTLNFLQTTQQGLSSYEAKKRKEIYGENLLKKRKERSPFQRFILQFHNMLIYILLTAALITLSLGHWIDSAVIFGVVILNTIIGFVQENKAEQALNALRNMLAPKTNIVRDNKKITVLASTLVPGDVVLLQSGDRIPADLRLFNIKSLQIQESILTGESVPVIKVNEQVSETTNLTDRVCMAYSGTLVTYGRGEGIVVATGQDTEVGHISQLISNIPSLKTPLLRQMDKFGRFLTAAILLLSTITFAIGALVWGDSSTTMFLAVVGLAVAAIPEGLPTIMTITLAMGVTRMAKRNVIIRHLPAVETMGSITTICTDKTGTLTHNELAVRRVIMIEHDYHVTGSGYDDCGEFHLNHSLFPLEEHPNLGELVRAGVLCNDAELLKEENDWKLQGNPLDGAFLSLGLKLKLDLNLEKEMFPRTDFIPFESQHKIMASLHHDHDGHGYIFVKGAPERVLARCSLQRSKEADEPINLDHWEKTVQTLAGQGQRLVAIAVKKTYLDHRELTFKDIDSGLILLGLVGLIDPPREEAIQAVAKCQAAGIKVKMITGDHAMTAQVIAKEVGIENFHEVITGEELDQLDDEALVGVAKNIDVYARTSPEHKLRLVKALQKNGEIVAMTGDGVNDAPALKQADIGVAMGKKGTEATKEVSDMVITDDNFVSIASAIEEGRTVYDNLKKSLLFVLPTNGGEAFIIVMAIVLGYTLPITAVQILWLNMVTSVTFALSLAFEPAENHIMRRLPRSPKASMLSTLSILHIVFVSTLMVICGYSIFIYERSIDTDLMAAQCAVVNMLIAGEFVYLLTCRKLHGSSKFWHDLTDNKALYVAVILIIVLQLAFTYLPRMDHFFGVSPIGIGAWIRIWILAIGMFIAVKVEKILINGEYAILNRVKKFFHR